MNQRDWFADVLEFHRAFDAHIEPLPRDPGDEVAWLRQRLITEEFMELVMAINKGDLPSIADGCIDLIYVTLGTLVSYGIDPAPLWDAVHRANMAKVGGEVREDGKRLKPLGWQPPDIKGLLATQGPIVEEAP